MACHSMPNRVKFTDYIVGDTGSSSGRARQLSSHD